MRFTTTVVVFFILLNAFAGALQASGMTAKWDAEPDTQAPTALEAAQSEAGEVEPTGGGLDTLFGLATSVGASIATIFGGALPAVSMLTDLGVPAWFVGYAAAPLTLISAIELADWLRGLG